MPDSIPPTRYGQVKHYVLDRVRSGEWPAGHRLPSESALVATLGVSRMTVHRALRELTAEGVVNRAQGVGTFVSPPAIDAEFLELRDIADDIAAGGQAHHARVVALETVRADMDLAIAFGQRPGARLFHSVIVHDEGGIPLQVEDRFVSPHFAPAYLAQDFSLAHPHRYLSLIARPENVEHVVFAITPDARLRGLLDLDTPEACLQLVRRTWVEGRVVMKGIFTYPGSRYSLSGRSGR
ncbi:transcriptional regulator, histidine utilization repressor, GntR family [Gluconacetobacter diazotrophicus PA1 5]|uniref:Histidine utilization repressor n=2 Tax=Gluconacetobacter diazotrophicus TaxID=33996 RepID=A9HNA7_GLUDA|nr:histidine utilization repressor [Gluconacetobacter diazotrophicus]ACI50511.1 transcriptional regulator, histidine utilization repressor, GntR family [Gluconacetobacter diazotrophicus PA1 5]MBB2155704.1 histidine utilization repressor [Gluconacetobacter diazotrophicus]TWB09343.1 GntR family histidine utilization transcriptional repressor [Gluconacetobacter diazotrophicus]CAP56417.1 transcriptional regulator, GntR family [Gluconacetobacter diazotrophicus PA1 5]